MNENLVESLTTQAKSLYGPMGKINALMIANVEKIAEFQLGAVKSYAELAMKQVKQVSEVRDIEGLKDFGTTQSEMASELGEKVMEDMKALGEIGMEFKAGVDEIITEARNPEEAKADSEEVAKEAPKKTEKA